MTEDLYCGGIKNEAINDKTTVKPHTIKNTRRFFQKKNTKLKELNFSSPMILNFWVQKYDNFSYELKKNFQF